MRLCLEVLPYCFPECSSWQNSLSLSQVTTGPPVPHTGFIGLSERPAVGIHFFAIYFSKCSTSSVVCDPAEVVEEKRYQEMGEVFSNRSLGESSIFFVRSSVPQQTPDTNQQLQSSPFCRQTPHTNQQLQFNPKEITRLANQPEARVRKQQAAAGTS